MLTLLTLALLAQGAEVKPLTPGFQFHGPSFAAPRKSWFATPSKAFGSTFEAGPFKGKPAPAREDGAALTCTITVLKADPKFDAKIARPAPTDIDPKMVRPSPCK